MMICLQKSNNHSALFLQPISKCEAFTLSFSVYFIFFHLRCCGRHCWSSPPFGKNHPIFQLLKSRNRVNSTSNISSKYLFGIFLVFAVHFSNDVAISLNCAFFLFSSQFLVRLHFRITQIQCITRDKIMVKSYYS